MFGKGTNGAGDCQRTSLTANQVQESIQLLEEGNTIPFIARYRKERTGELDEERLRGISERFQYLTQLTKRKEEIIQLIDKQGKLTDSLKEQIHRAQNYKNWRICTSLSAQAENQCDDREAERIGAACQKDQRSRV